MNRSTSNVLSFHRLIRAFSLIMLSRLCCRQNGLKFGSVVKQVHRQLTSDCIKGLKANVRIVRPMLVATGATFYAALLTKLLFEKNLLVVYSKELDLASSENSYPPKEFQENDENLPPTEEKAEEAKSTFLGVPMQFWREILDISKGKFWVLAVAMISAFASAYFNVKIGMQIGDLINVISRYIHVPDAATIQSSSAEANADFSYLTSDIFKPLSRLIFSYVAQAVATFSYISAMSYFGEHLGVELRVRLLERLLLMDAQYYDTRHRTGGLLNSITHDTQQFKSAFKQVVGQGLKNTVQMIGCAYSLVILSPTLALSLGVPLCGMIFVGSAIGRILRKWSHSAQENLTQATALASESLYGVATIRAFAAEKEQTDRYANQLRSKFLRAAVTLGGGIGALQALSNLAINGMVVGVVFLGGWQISTGHLTPGELMSFLMASQSLQRCMAQTSVLISDVIKGCSSASRMAEILMLTPAIPYSGGRKVPFHSLIGDIDFKDVTVIYKSRHSVKDFEFDTEADRQAALNGINFSIDGGTMVAITGPSGAGKSTLASLMERFYDPTAGSIFLDKIDLRLYDLHWLRHRAIGYVGQEPVLFAGTVRDNIRFGRPEASDQEVIEAAQAASADQFIRSDLPNGYDTMIGERGVLLSGGQKQRIALARALIKDPPILVLDEITSALDAESERAIHRALEQGSPHGRTVILITHRLNWARSAHKIVVVDGGKVVEEGPHEKLLANRGMYYKLWNEQHKAGGPSK